MSQEIRTSHDVVLLIDNAVSIAASGGTLDIPANLGPNAPANLDNIVLISDPTAADLVITYDETNRKIIVTNNHGSVAYTDDIKILVVR